MEVSTDIEMAKRRMVMLKNIIPSLKGLAKP